MKNKTIKQSLIEIEKRLERIEQQIAGKTLLDRPYAPMPTETYPKGNVQEDEKSIKYKPKIPYSNNIICPKCGKDTGIGMILNMVIPPEGLACPHCSETVVAGSTITFCDATVPKGVGQTTASSIKYTWDNSSAIAGDSVNFKNE